METGHAFRFTNLRKHWLNGQSGQTDQSKVFPDKHGCFTSMLWLLKGQEEEQCQVLEEARVKRKSSARCWRKGCHQWRHELEEVVVSGTEQSASINHI